MRDRLTLLITEHKSKIRQEENAAGITCKEIELTDNWQEKLADKKSSEVKKKEKEEGAAREEL